MIKYKPGDVVVCIDVEPTRDLHNSRGFGYEYKLGNITVVKSVQDTNSGQQILFSNAGLGIFSDVVELYGGKEGNYEIY